MKRTPLARVSRKRKRDLGKRNEVRLVVLERDRTCQADGLAPGSCATYGGRASLEVHEVLARSQSSISWLTPADCIAVCPKHHDWITEHPLEAKALGLRRSTWDG